MNFGDAMCNEDLQGMSVKGRRDHVVDFNNAVIEQIEKEGEDLRLRFGGANAHPADDPTNAQKLAVEIYLKKVATIGDIPKLPVDLDDCYILVNMTPTTLSLPSEKSADIELQLVFTSGALVINSKSIRVTSIEPG